MIDETADNQEAEDENHEEEEDLLQQIRQKQLINNGALDSVLLEEQIRECRQVLQRKLEYN